MSIWAKLLGGVAGMALGGPFGAVVGAALGHAAENGGFGRGARLFDGLLGGGGGGFAPAGVSAMFGRRDEVFALCVVVLSAKLAKCDGPVNREEIAGFKQRFSAPPEAASEIGRLFDNARESAAGFEEYARQLGDTFEDTPGVLEEVLTALFAIAVADRPVNQAEVRFLRVVAQRFHLGEAAWNRAREPAARSFAPARDPVADAYAMLGAATSDSDETVRARWIRLVRDNHPDTLASRGVTADFVARASDTVARANAAWDRIKRERGL